MNKTELKNFAVSARRDLLEKVALRAKIFGIDENNGLTIEEQFGQVVINGSTYPQQMKSAFQSLANQLKTKGYEQLIEEVAYTWFNRIIAIRYMEVNNYLPERVNILSSSTGKVEPDILSEFEMMDLHADVSNIKDLIRKGDTEQAFRKLFISQCNVLNPILPFMFEKIRDYTELLLPDFLLDSESVISKLVKNVSKGNFHNEEGGKDNVEILGWLYQYYMAEKKEKVGGLKNTAVKKEDLPVVTQLFTPKWIVQYMVQNSLGKLYDEKYPNNNLASNWDYYLKKSSKEKLLTEFDSLEEIKIIDPACGSGHILLYAFDMLYDMYEEAGYPSRDIPKLILEKNLYGLDIDKRAQQIAYFALIMKAIEKQPRFLRRNQGINLNVIEIVETDYSLSNEAIEFFVKEQIEIEKIKKIQDIFENGKQFGSLVLPFDMDYKEWIDRIGNFSLDRADLVEQTYIQELKDKLLPLLKIAWLLVQKYDVVITNPPYHNKYNPTLKLFVNKFYNDYKSDLYSAFIYRTALMTADNGYSALMTPFTWMFNQTNEKLRTFIINNNSISSFIQLEYHAFFEEADVPICTFVIQNQTTLPVGDYIRLAAFTGAEVQPIKVKEAIEKKVEYRFQFNNNDFHRLPGSPITYWIPNSVQQVFCENKQVASLAEPKAGLQTGDNDRFLRLWFEVQNKNIKLNAKNASEAVDSTITWFPYNKGGNFRKWYGNQAYVINWKNDGEEIKSFKGSVIRNPSYYFREGITWTTLTAGIFSARYTPVGFLFDTKGSSLFSKNNKDLHFILGTLQSKVVNFLLSCLSETMDYSVGQLSKLPINISVDDITKVKITNLVQENIDLSKRDWDSFETSWNFICHPFLIYKQDYKHIAQAFDSWTKHTKTQFVQLKTNEEEINRIFIDLYGLQSDLTSAVQNKEITIRKADRIRDSKSFLSYVIGCIMGRYSLDIGGLAYAGGDWDDSKYKTFKSNKFGLIQLTDEHYFEDDIIVLLREFLSATFGAETIEENLKWLAESLELKRNETVEERFRRYFLDEFFKDHCQMYQKRPIYWLVDSGKEKGLRTLIYMHRYQPDTMATIRFEHLQEIQAKYNNEIAAVDLRIVNPNLSATEKRDLEKRKVAYQKRLNELLEFDKNLAENANAQIVIDLDDGVKVNYAKFDKVLAKIK